MADEARLTALLFGALLSSRWPESKVEILRSDDSYHLSAGETLIINAVSQRSLSVFAQPPTPAEVARRLQRQGCSLMMFDASGDELESALEALEGGPPFVSAQLVRLLTNSQSQPRNPTLTSREEQVLRLVAQGLSNREVAEELIISPNTVRTHLRSISAQLGVTSRGKLAVKARELKLA
ncbi:MAG: response regulator transcription factor [Dehalococcoidia bacterium]